MSERNSAFADAVRERVNPDEVSQKSTTSGVFVRVGIRRFDDVCAVAYDHGFVPLGVIESKEVSLAARFKPRGDSEAIEVA